MRTAAGLQAHVDECGRQWGEAKAALQKLGADLEDKHAQNIERFEKFQQKIYIIALLIVAGIAVKGTPLDVIAKLFAGL